MMHLNVQPVKDYVMQKDTNIPPVRIRSEHREALEQEAEAADRPLSSLVRRILLGWLRERGYDV